jgi:putative alpha-1,2-mannosidase
MSHPQTRHLLFYMPHASDEISFDREAGLVQAVTLTDPNPDRRQGIQNDDYRMYVRIEVEPSLLSDITVQKNFEVDGVPINAAVLTFRDGVSGQKDSIVAARVCTSFISHAQAELTMRRELGVGDQKFTFDRVKEQAKSAWRKHLSRVKIYSEGEGQGQDHVEEDNLKVYLQHWS